VYWLQLELDIPSQNENVRLDKDTYPNIDENEKISSKEQAKQNPSNETIECALSSCKHFDFLRLFNQYFPSSLSTGIKTAHVHHFSLSSFFSFISSYCL
jgi:hypothetical protein